MSSPQAISVFARKTICIFSCIVLLLSTSAYANAIDPKSHTFETYFVYPDGIGTGTKISLKLSGDMRPGGMVDVNYSFSIDDPKLTELFQRKSKLVQSLDSRGFWKISPFEVRALAASEKNSYLVTAFRALCDWSSNDPLSSKSPYEFDDSTAVIITRIPGTKTNEIDLKSLDLLTINGMKYELPLIGMDTLPKFSYQIPNKDCGYLHFRSRTHLIIEADSNVPGTYGQKVEKISFRYAPYTREGSGYKDIRGLIDLVSVKPGKKCDPNIATSRKYDGIKFDCKQVNGIYKWIETTSAKKKPSDSTTSAKNSTPPKKKKPSVSSNSNKPNPNYSCANLAGASLPKSNVGLEVVGFFLSLVVTNPTGCNLNLQITTTFLEGQQCQAFGTLNVKKDQRIVVSLWPADTPGSISAYDVFPQLRTCVNTKRQFVPNQVLVNQIVSAS